MGDLKKSLNQSKISVQSSLIDRKIFREIEKIYGSREEC